MKKTPRRLLIGGTAFVAVAAVSSYLVPGTAQAAPLAHPAPAANAPVPAYTPPAIQWSACTNGLQAYGADCGFLVVPLDYSKPNGTKIKIAVSKISHTSAAADYQGAVVVNLTDAGGSALSQSVVGQVLPSSISGDYDWIGFDPRGVGSSQPSLSCDPTVNSPTRPAYTPASVSDLNAWIKRSENYATACAKTKSELLDHATTIDSAYDLDALRKALGQKQLNYYGYLYGAYLGEVYASLYPNNTRRLILDTSVAPSQTWLGFNIGQNAPLQQNLDAFSTWVAKYNGVYHLGTTKAAVEKQYNTTLAALTKHPVGGELGPDVWTDLFLLAYNTGNWEDLAGVFSAYVNTGDTTGLQELYEANYTTTDDNSFAMSLATECTDTSWPRNWGTWLSATEQSARKAPLAAWADTWFVAPCESWSAPAQRPAVIGAKNVPVLMVLDTTLDPASSLQASLQVRALFPKAVLVESGATPASTTTPNSCSPGTSIAEYLAADILPTRVSGNKADLKCPANALPDPTSASALNVKKAAVAAGPAGL